MGWYDNTHIQAPRTIGYDQGQNSTLQAIDLFRRGLNDFASISNDYRIFNRRDVANKAIEDLMAKKPDKTIDPTQHIGEVSRLLAFASPEMRDTVKAYTNSLDTNYGRELQNQQFLKNMDMNQKQLDEQVRAHNLSYKAQMAQLDLSKQQNAFNRKIQELELAAKGYVPNGKGGFDFNPEKSAAYKAMEMKQINENNEKIIQLASKAKLDDFITGSQKAMSKWYGGVSSTPLNALFSEATTSINNPAIPQNIRAGLANALLQNNPQGIIDLLGQNYEYKTSEGIKTGVINPNRTGQIIKPSFGFFDNLEKPEVTLKK